MAKIPPLAIKERLFPTPGWLGPVDFLMRGGF